MNDPLKYILIQRIGDAWVVSRVREANGEKLVGARDLEEAFNFIRALYDKDGNQLPAMALEDDEA